MTRVIVEPIVCPLQNKCLNAHIVYQAKTRTNNEQENTYVESNERPWKENYINLRDTIITQKYPDTSGFAEEIIIKYPNRSLKACQL